MFYGEVIVVVVCEGLVCVDGIDFGDFVVGFIVVE